MEYKAKIIWERGTDTFTDNRYSRAHRWLFDEGIEVPASSSPHVVPLPYSISAAVDPEEAFVASVSSCHMLWFLFIAAKKNICVDSYSDEASGTMGKDDNGNAYISHVVLKPRVLFSGDPIPTKEELNSMHDEAHKKCFIANSIKSIVECNPIG